MSVKDNPAQKRDNSWQERFRDKFSHLFQQDQDDPDIFTGVSAEVEKFIESEKQLSFDEGRKEAQKAYENKEMNTLIAQLNKK